jgi:Holliday junction resolvase RusA-like endonuclease
MEDPVVVDLTSDEWWRPPIPPEHRIEIPGQPHCLPRARISWQSQYKHYNPASKELLRFKNSVKAMIPDTQHGHVYPRGMRLCLTLIFYMRRPNSDFRNNQRGIDRLRQLLPFARPQVPDIDNLAKFVLDGLNNLLYEDDRQVVKLTVYKLLDNHGSCDGRTIIISTGFDFGRDHPPME